MMAETQSELDPVSARLPSLQGAWPVVGAPPRRASACRAAASIAATGSSSAPQLEHSRLIEELRASRLRVIQAAEHERRRLEQDLHDGAQQRLVEIQIRLAFARTLVDSADLASELDAIQEAAEAALDELRTLARGIYPSTLRDLGPAAALRTLAQRSPVPIRVIDEGIGEGLGADRSSALLLRPRSDPERHQARWTGCQRDGHPSSAARHDRRNDQRRWRRHITKRCTRRNRPPGHA